MPSIIAMAIFGVLTIGCTQWASAKEDGVPDRRVGGGTRLEVPQKLPQTSNQRDDRQNSRPKANKAQGTIMRPVRL